MTDTKKVKKDHLKFEDRIGEFIGIIMLMLFAGFFIRHQRIETGFFTDEFGGLEMTLFYGSMFIAVFPPLIRAFIGRRNIARPWDIFSNLFGAMTAAWLLMVFPFDFTHLADALPESIQFVLDWVTDDIGKIPMILQIVFMPITAIVYAWQYLTFHRPEINEVAFQ